MTFWITFLAVAFYVDGALIVKWLVDRGFPIPAARKGGA